MKYWTTKIEFWFSDSFIDKYCNDKPNLKNGKIKGKIKIKFKYHALRLVSLINLSTKKVKIKKIILGLNLTKKFLIWNVIFEFRNFEIILLCNLKHHQIQKYFCADVDDELHLNFYEN